MKPDDHTPTQRRQAVALSRAGGAPAPRVVAKGYGVTADTIVQRARDAGLHVQVSPELAPLLMQVELDAHIPPALYRAVAELLAWVQALEGTGCGKP